MGKPAATGQVGTPSPSANPASVRAANNAAFLKFAPKIPLPVVQGTLATGSAGGGNAIYNFSEQIPAIPVWATDIEFFNYLQVKIASPASGSFTVSPWAPWCFLSSQLTLAGSPPWNLMEHTPWALDCKRVGRNFDPLYPGLGMTAAGPTNNPPSSPVATGTTAYATGFPQVFAYIEDFGPYANPGAMSIPVAPGLTVSNSGSASGGVLNYTHVWGWVDHIRLQRMPSKLIGCVPLGDPENRPRLKVILNPLVAVAGAASQPQSTPYVNCSANTTGLTSGTQSTVNMIIRAARLDVLPNGVSIPPPEVGMGVTVNAYQVNIPTSAQIQQYLHQQSMLYTAIDHLIINGGVAQESDYFALWLSQEQRSNRWEYDQQQSTYQAYFQQWFERYNRYPEIGWLCADFDRGELPELPALTPYDAFMTPDFGYAQAFGVVPTPNMTTAQRIPSTSLTNAYAQIYEWGLVNVPY